MESRKRKNGGKEMLEDVKRKIRVTQNMFTAEVTETIALMRTLRVQYKKLKAEKEAADEQITQLREQLKATQDELALLKEAGAS